MSQDKSKHLRPAQLDRKNGYIPIEYIYVLAFSREEFDRFREKALASPYASSDSWFKPSSGEFGFMHLCYRYVPRPEYLQGVRGFFYILPGFFSRSVSETRKFQHYLDSRRVFGDLEACPEVYLP